MADELKPCPFCGKVDTLEFATRRELEDCPDFDDCEAETCGRGFCDVYDNWDCIVCSVSKGGCGASGGYDECPAKAIEKWNTRHESSCSMEYAKHGMMRGWWVCSACGKAMDTIEACSGKVPPRFCGNCGATVKTFDVERS